MSAKKPSIHQIPAPEEWDFRRVSKKELPTVLAYEYARSSERFRSLIMGWLDHAFCGFSRDALSELNAHGKFAGRAPQGPMAVRKALGILGSLKPTPLFLPRSEIEATRPPKLVANSEAARFAAEFDRFPIAWLRLPEDYRSDRINTMVRVSPGGVFEVAYGLDINAAKYRKCREQLYAFVIKWDWSDKELLAKFKRWLKFSRPKAFPGKGRVGRGSEPPFHWLKQLAAWRLSQAGYSSEPAAALIANRRREDRGESEFDVLPVYNSSGAWSKAVQSAAELLASEDMFERIDREAIPETRL